MDSISLVAEPRSVGRARAFVSSLLADRGTDLFVALLLTSELATNVVRHAESDFTVMVALESCVRVEVHDAAAATDAFRALVANPPAVSSDSPGGRGLPLVRRLATRFGLDDEPGVRDGKVVWFETELNDGRSAASLWRRFGAGRGLGEAGIRGSSLPGPIHSIGPGRNVLAVGVADAPARPLAGKRPTIRSTSTG